MPMMRVFHRKAGRPGITATKGQVASMYAPMLEARAPAPPPPPICTRCTGPLDTGTGYCERCRYWPLLNPEGPR